MAYTDIDKPSDYFNTVLYTGNGSTQSITGVGFQPDWVWLKQRANDVANRNHMLFDSNRGTQKALSSNTTDAEDTSTAYLTSYDSDGFTLGSSSVLNRNTTTYASWNWLASNTTASNTDGSITSTVSASTVSGFSIVSYTGTGSLATVGHGLGVAPSMIFGINRTNGGNWFGYHKSLSATQNIQLNQTSASSTNSTFYNNTEPTSSVFTINTNSDINTSGNNLIAYCFAEKKGFSKFGSYTGNGSTDGTFVYTGFKPAFVIGKRTNDVEDWFLFDSARDTYNVNNKLLYPNGTNAEYTGVSARNDFLSNGFKMRITDNKENGAGSTYIYMAFAENPFVTSTGIPTTAR